MPGQQNSAVRAIRIDGRHLTPGVGGLCWAALWFGVYGYANSEEENASLDNPDWSPLAWAWGQTAEHIAEHVAHVAAEDIAQLYNGDRDTDADADNAAALVAMFEIPLDTITTRASDKLHKAIDADKDANSQDNINGTDDMMAKDSPEPSAPAVTSDMDELTDPGDSISIECVPYLQTLADAQ